MFRNQFIKLHNSDGSEIYVNYSYIISVKTEGVYTVIKTMFSDEKIMVTETPNEIFKSIKATDGIVFRYD